MYKGTTPTYTFTTPEGLDLSQMEKVYVTFSRQDGTEIMTKTGDDLIFKENSVTVRLTQEESLNMPSGTIKIQLNWLFYNDEHVLDRACSNILNVNAYRNLKNEILGL